MKRAYDIAIAGSGFAGSLMAMIAKRMGYSVVLLERGWHPRFSIGESSTPLANLLLEELAKQYDLPMIQPLAKWGSWQRAYPKIPCGLKRGFTFYHHQLGASDAPDPERKRQLLVAASPHEAVADTHWYRAGFDAFLVEQAQAMGVQYLDRMTLDSFVDGEDEAAFQGIRDGLRYEFRAKFFIDATGPRGFLHRSLSIPEAALPAYPETQALYSHFSGVSMPRQRAEGECEEPPYPPEDAAVHHVFDGGWAWVLRFNNGVTSAGVAATESAGQRLNLKQGEAAWTRFVHSVPALREQFAVAHPVQPFVHLPRIAWMSGQVCGRRWAMLPSSAGFIDPLLSTGFPLTLLGIGRLAAILAGDWNRAGFQAELQSYANRTRDELHTTARLIGALYANMHNFAVFKSLALLYFAAASYSETARRLHKPHLAQSFLLHDHPKFGVISKALLDRASDIKFVCDSGRLTQDILNAIKPLDVAGLCHPGKRSWYPVSAEDLLSAAGKVESTRGEIECVLQACGFYPE